jgi:hypothetical protein
MSGRYKTPEFYVGPAGERFKFDECIACLNRRSPDVCTACTSGELFEPEDTTDELDFHDGRIMRLEDLE